MGTFVSSKARWFFSMAAVAAILSASVLTGCGDKENNPVGPGGGLVLGPGEAWAEDYEPGNRDAFIFLESGKVLLIDDYDGEWEIYMEGTWSASGNTLTITMMSGSPQNFTYVISGNTLTTTHATWGTDVYHKISGVNISTAKARENGERPASTLKKRWENRAN
jgi:hypothetical protein